MTAIRLISFLLFAPLHGWAGTASASEGSDAAVSKPATVRAEVQVISVSQSRGLQIVPLLRQPERFPGGAERVRAMLESGEAELVDQLQTETLAGQKSVAESSTLLPYQASKQTSSGLCFPNSFDKSLAHEIKARKEGDYSGERAPRQWVNAPLMKRMTDWLESPPFPFNPGPTAEFDNRYVGLSLEFEPRLRDGGWLEVDALVQRIQQEGFCIPLSPGDAPQPRFTVWHTQARVRVQSGQLTLVGAEPQPGASPRLLLHFLRLFVTHPKPNP